MVILLNYGIFRWIMPFTYPATRAEFLEESIAGIRIRDDYRHLEVPSEERTRWITAQNELTYRIISSIPEKDAIASRLEELVKTDKYDSVDVCNGRVFYKKRGFSEDISSVYYRNLPDGDETLLIDARTLSKDGTAGIETLNGNSSGRFLAYSVSDNGHDWEHWYIMDVEKRKIVDEIPRLAYTSIMWLTQKNSFFYSRSSADDPAKLSKLDHNLYIHKVGTDWRDDVLFFEGDGPVSNPHVATMTADDKKVIVSVMKSFCSNEIYYIDRSKRKLEAYSLTRGIDANFLCAVRENMLYIMTNHEAPNNKLCKVSLNGDIPTMDRWETIVPNGRYYLSSFNVFAKKVYLSKRVNARDFIYECSCSGENMKRMKTPFGGTVSIPFGMNKTGQMFYNIESFFDPERTYCIGKNSRSGLFVKNSCDFDPADFMTEQLWFRSRDNTEVPMFVLRKKDIVLDGSNPTILYGYGGFGNPTLPYFSAARILWLERGGIIAFPNIRGGDDFNSKWHRDGYRDKKQNCFDDFIAAAEALIGENPTRVTRGRNLMSRKYTSREHLGIWGGSNGGLLVGAVTTQRPDLFSAVICDMPLLDMTRFHLTEGGKFWVTEYGNPDDPKDLEYLLRYSPYHNVKSGTGYPAMLICTSLGDDRGTDPMHAMKMAAAMQEANSSENPILLKVDGAVGHGGSDSLGSNLSEMTVFYSFFTKFLR